MPPILERLRHGGAKGAARRANTPRGWQQAVKKAAEERAARHAGDILSADQIHTLCATTTNATRLLNSQTTLQFHLTLYAAAQRAHFTREADAIIAIAQQDPAYNPE
eukprot:3569128-Amphidinium_carterae.1